MKRARKSTSPTVTVAQIRAAKARDRQRDWQRLAQSEVTPEQLQQENAVVKNAAAFRILNDRAAADFFRQRLRSSR